MKNVLTFDEFLYESMVNEAVGTYVVKHGSAYQSLWNNSTPSVSYKETSPIFNQLKDAMKWAQDKLKTQKTETTVGQGGIPGGYSYMVTHLYEITPEMNPEEWTAEYQATKAGAKKIELTSSGKLMSDANKMAEELKSFSNKENVDQIMPDSKDLQRAESLFKGDWSNGDKVETQLVSIGDPKKLIRRMKAMLYTQINTALSKKIYYKNYELDKGLDRWFDGFPWYISHMSDFRSKYYKKWGVNLTYEDLHAITKAVKQSVYEQIKNENS
jgi:hypothetical protein